MWINAESFAYNFKRGEVALEYPLYIDLIIQRLYAHGESAYIVGGSLRDVLLGVVPHDYDIATSALPQRTAELFSDKHVIETGLKHGTVTVVFDGYPVEITTFRVDGSYTDMRHPDSVSFTDDIILDLSRRDFTVNAMAFSRERGLIDPFGGREDIKKRLIRAVGDPERRFSEDALRIMRAFRFSAQLGFNIDEETLIAAKRCAGGLSLIARERIGNEVQRLICSPDPAQALRLMRQYGAWEYVFGDFVPSDRVLDGLSLMPRDVTARLGLFMCEAEQQQARELLRGLRCSGKQTTGALAVARGAVIEVGTDSDARRLISCVGIYAPLAAKASEIIGVSHVGAYERVAREQSKPCSVRELAVNGKDIAGLGARGKLIGRTLDALLSLVIDDPSLNERARLLELAKKIVNGEVENDRA